MARRSGWSAPETPFLVDALQATMHEARELWARAAAQSPELSARLAEQAEATEHIDRVAAEGVLIWVDRSLCRMVEETAPTVPEWSPAAVLPAPSGVMLFDTPVAPLVWVDEDEALPATCDGVAWDTREGVVRFQLLTRLRQHRDRLSPIRVKSPVVVALTCAFPTTAVMGAGLEFASRQGEVVREAGHAAIAAIGACWLLMGQQSVVEDTPTVVRRRTPRAGGANREVVSPVVTVSERRLRRRRRDRAGGGGTRGVATSRWWVRGHWRQQPYGPGRALRRPVFIEPHTAGAADAPVVERRRVERWRE